VRYVASMLTATTLLFLICTWRLGVGNAADAYTTTRGDTLWEIARRYIPDDTISTYQVMLALWRANPDAFVDHNMNHLKAGYVLHIPAREAMLAIRPEAAIAEVARQQTSPSPSEVANESVAATSPEPPVSVPETRPASWPETTFTDTAGTIPEASAQDIARLRHDLALAREQATQHQSENEALWARVMTLEEKLTKLDDRIAMQHERFDNPPQRPAEAGTRDLAPAPSTAGNNDTADVTPTSLPSRVATWLTVPRIVMVISAIGLLGLAWLGLRARRTPANVTPDEIAARLAQQSRDAQPPAEEDKELGAAHRQAGPEAAAAEPAAREPKRAAETPLADLMIDLDDLELEPDQGEEAVGLGSAGTADAAAAGADSVDRPVSPSRPNAASMSRKAEEASPSNTC
jgi:pilus assembly protein FimV